MGFTCPEAKLMDFGEFDLVAVRGPGQGSVVFHAKE
jgi:hypothetical protein